MSLTRGKSKEHIQSYLASIFNDRVIESSGRISDPTIKKSRAEALADLREHDRFIWEPPEYKMGSDGKFVLDEDEKSVVTRNTRDPFTRPYIRNAVRYLFLEDLAEWRRFPKDSLTAPQLAFVVTLVCFL